MECRPGKRAGCARPASWLISPHDLRLSERIGAMSKFEGFGPEVCDWFAGLEADNTKEYFAARRDLFEGSIREQMEALLTELSRTFGGEVKMFRQNRDIRFSA